MKKIFLLSLLALSSLVIFIIPLVSAHCPLCTAAAGAGVGVARFYGVDDSIVGLLLGGFVASSGLWIHNWLKRRTRFVKREINIPYQAVILVVLSFILLTVPLYTSGIITDVAMVKSMPQHHAIFGLGIYGIDKLLFGLIFGTLLISGVFSLSDYVKEKRGRRLFPFQGMILMILSLAIFSGIFWYVI